MPKLAVVGVRTICQIEIDASAAARRSGQLNQSPPLCLIVVVVFRPGGRGGEPAQSSKGICQHRVAYQPASIDPDAVAAASESGIHLLEVGDNIRQFVRRFPCAIYPIIYCTATRL